MRLKTNCEPEKIHSLLFLCCDHETSNVVGIWNVDAVATAAMRQRFGYWLSYTIISHESYRFYSRSIEMLRVYV